MAYGAILGQSLEGSPVLNDYYTKQQTLSASTAALFGLGADAVPDSVFYELGRSLYLADENNIVVEKIVESTTWIAPAAFEQKFRVMGVGAGGARSKSTSEDRYSGGGGGYVEIQDLTIPAGTRVSILCGAYVNRPGSNGGDSVFGGYFTAKGGKGGQYWSDTSCHGGDGGAGGGGFGDGTGGYGDTYGGGGGGGGGAYGRDYYGRGGNGGAYGGGGGAGTNSTGKSGSAGYGGTYGGRGGAAKNGSDGTAVEKFSKLESAGENMSTSGTGGHHSVSSTGYSSGGGGGGGYGGNGGRGDTYGGGGGGGLFDDGADAKDIESSPRSDAGRGGGLVNGDGGFYILYYKYPEKE